MSNLLFMDESNGNGVYASKTHATTHANNTNNITNIMNASTTTTTASALPTSLSNEDLSQSLSEYTDADESISAPTEFLAEFLSAVMLKDYKKALKYCKLILQYEPNNATAKEFYPLILDKLRVVTTSSDSDENYNKSSSSPEMVLELQTSDPSAGESDASDDQQACGTDDAADEYGVSEDNSSGEPNSNESHMSSCCASAGESLSESVDDEEDDVDDDDIDVDGEEEEEEEEEGDAISSSGDDLPNDDQQGSGADDGICTTGNGSHSSGNSSSGGEGRSRSDNTTHSYSSLLLEEEDDIVPVNLQFAKELSSTDLDVSNGNKLPSASCSDSESPTEPLTQRLAAILLSKCGVSNNDEK